MWVGVHGLTLAQIALGVAGVKTVHVPMGALMFAASILQLNRVMAGRTPLAATPSGTDQPDAGGAVPR